ncbi:uncharacterized protein LOC143291615 [Babylonia areolata]|uniref:uncharacterized protein LOC143291615 n=1 Tax=Babylonia areolata TaxID=304850 RepID=UPI003FCEF639
MCREMAVSLAAIVFLSVALAGGVLGGGDLTLSPCGSDHTAEVIHGKKDNSFTCSGLDREKEVTWNVGSTIVGSCKSGGNCSKGNLGDVFVPSRVSETKVKMVIDPTQLKVTTYLQEGTLRCFQSESSLAECQMDYIVPAKGTCNARPGTESSRFKLDASCNLEPGANSSRGRFSCTWEQHGLGSWKKTVNLTKDNYRTGCILTHQPLPTTSGLYNYTVTLLPGRLAVDAGTVRIKKPAVPAVSGCGGEGYIPENTTISCMCTTDTIGEPFGRLRWMKFGHRNHAIIKDGGYGNSSLALSLTLHRNDHQHTRYRCDVEWTEDMNGSAVEFKVGYPPTGVFLGLNGRQSNRTVDEHRPVDFTCQNSNGRPDPTLSLVKTDNNTVLANKTTHLSHKVVGRCEDSGQYVCTADNGMGPPFTGSPRSLAVQCYPRGQKDVGELNFNDQPVSRSFNVTAYPVPDGVTFHYLGPNGTSEETDVDVEHIKLAGECQQKSNPVYQSSCTVTVNNATSDSVAGVYKVSVTNKQGKGEFLLQVLYRAPVTDAPDPGTKEESNTGAIVGGLAAVVVIIAVIILVVVVAMKRRKDPDKEKLHTSAGDGQGRGSHGGVDNPSLVPPQPLLMAPPPVDGEQYAVVVKPKKAAAAAAVKAETASGSGGDVYAVVDKTKKKKPAAEAEGETASGSGGDVYAVVDKTRKNKKAAGAGARGKGKAKKGRGKKEDVDGGHIYGNVDTEGAGKTQAPAAAAAAGTQPPRAEEKEKAAAELAPGCEISPEGLIYYTVEFDENSVSQPRARPPKREATVLYSEVNYSKTDGQP